MYRTLLNTFTLVLSIALLVLMSPLAEAQDSTAQEESMAKVKSTAEADIVQTLKSTKGLATLESALKAAGLVETLQGEGPFTVFAPTDEAFASLPDSALDNLLTEENKSDLQSLLTYHVVDGMVTAEDITTMEDAETLEGSTISIDTENGTVLLMGENNARVTKKDISASNGVIHMIDTVLRTPVETASKK